MIKFVIWGAGVKGHHVFSKIGKDMTKAFLDTDESKQGGHFLGKPVIGFDDYCKEYMDCPIIISFEHENEGVDILKNKNISNYYLLTDCPGEYQEPWERDYFEKYVKSIISPQKKYEVVGVSLFSFQLCEWIFEITGSIPRILYESEEEKRKLENLSSNDIVFSSVDKTDADAERLYVTYKNDSIRESIRGEKNARYLYDCSFEIPEYYNPLVEEFRDKHKGERCFVVGNGPSVRIEDLDKIYSNKDVSFGFNFAWRAFDRTLWRPTYYMATDYYAYKYYSEVIDSMTYSTLFLSDGDKDFWEKKHPPNVIRIHENCEFAKHRYPSFSLNPSRCVYPSYTVVYPCIQLALFMGFTNICLIGCDMDYSPKNGAQHFYGNEEDVKEGYNGFHLDIVERGYEIAAQYARKRDCNIYNATRGGKLEVFTRIEFDSLF